MPGPFLEATLAVAAPTLGAENRPAFTPVPRMRAGSMWCVLYPDMGAAGASFARWARSEWPFFLCFTPAAARKSRLTAIREAALTCSETMASAAKPGPRVFQARKVEVSAGESFRVHIHDGAQSLKYTYSTANGDIALGLKKSSGRPGAPGAVESWIRELSRTNENNGESVTSVVSLPKPVSAETVESRPR